MHEYERVQEGGMRGWEGGVVGTRVREGGRGLVKGTGG